MPFTLAILFESVLNVDGLVHQVLAVHGLNRLIGRFERVVRDEAIAHRLPRIEVALDLQCRSVSANRVVPWAREIPAFAVCTRVPKAVKVS